MNTASYVCVVAIALFALPGCDDLQLQGRLGNGEFDYVCGVPGDAACDGTDEIIGFDLDRAVPPLAVGGSFDLQFEDSDTVVAPATLASVYNNGVDFEFTAPSTVDFLAFTSIGEVVDFVDLTSRQPDSIAIFHDGGAVSSITLNSYDRVDIAAAPTASGEVLGGGFSYSWSVAGSGVEILSATDNASNVITIKTDSSGVAATITATMGNFSETITVSTP